MLKRFVLKNGLKTLFFPMKNTEAATLLFLTRTGSKYETKDNNGISHLLEHLLFRGTKKYPLPTDISRALDGVGGIYNAFTDKEMLGIIVKVTPENFSLAAEIISQMASHPLLEEKEIEKEKRIVGEEINMREDMPQIQVMDFFEEVLYGDQPAGWPVIGEKKILEKLDRHDLMSYFKKSFVSQNSIISIAGKLSERVVVRQINKHFSFKGADSAAEKKAIIEKQVSPVMELRFKDTDQSHLCLGVRGFNAFAPQKYVLEIIAAILGGMMSSRLFIEIREKAAMAYYLKTEAEEYTDSGYLVTHAGIASNRLGEAIKIICREYQRLKSQSVPLKELNKAKESIRGHFKLNLETSEHFASFFGLQEILGKKILTPDQEWRQIAKITSNDILKVAKEIFVPARLNLAIIGPHKDKKEFKNILKV